MKRHVGVSHPFFGCDGQRKAHIVLLESAKNLYEVAIDSTISQQLVNGRSYISYNVIKMPCKCKKLCNATTSCHHMIVRLRHVVVS